MTLHADPAKVPCWPCHRLHDTPDTCNPIKINGNDFASCMSDMGVEVLMRAAAKVLHRGE